MIAVGPSKTGQAETPGSEGNARLTYVLFIDAERQTEVDALIARVSGASFYVICPKHDRPGNLPAGQLSQRLEQVLRLIRQGMSNKSIGRQLGISHFTVRNHVARLLRIYDARNRDELKALTQALRPA